MSMIIVNCIVDTKRMKWQSITNDSTFNILGLNVSHDVVFTVATTLIIFILGLLLQKYIENKKEKKRILAIEASIISHIRMLKIFVTKQSEIFKSYSKSLSRKMIDNYDLGIETEIHTKHIGQIKSEDLFKIFVLSKKNKDKVELFAKLMNNIECIKENKAFVKNDFIEMRKSLKKFEQEWYENTTKISKFFDKEFSRADKSGYEDFMLKFWEYYTPWMHSGLSRDLQYNIDNFLKPVNELCKEHGSDSRALELMTVLRDTYNAIKNYMDLCELRSKSFDEHAGLLVKKYEDIRSIVRELYGSEINLNSE